MARELGRDSKALGEGGMALEPRQEGQTPFHKTGVPENHADAINGNKLHVVEERKVSEQIDSEEREIPARHGEEPRLQTNRRSRRKGDRMDQRVESQQTIGFEPAGSNNFSKQADSLKGKKEKSNKKEVHQFRDKTVATTQFASRPPTDTCTQLGPPYSETGMRNEELMGHAPREEIEGFKSVGKDTGENSKNHLFYPSEQANINSQGELHLRVESGTRGQNLPVDIFEGSGEHSPMGRHGIYQTEVLGENSQVALFAGPQERIIYHTNNLPSQESASGKCNYNKESSEGPLPSETNFAEIEVHPRERRRRHSDTEASIGRFLNLTSEDAMDIGESDWDSDEDSISMSYLARFQS